MKSLRRTVALASISGVCLAGVLAGPAHAQVEQDGLVNVNVGDVTILEDVRVALGAQVIAQICGVKVGPVVVLGRSVDRSGDTETVCEADAGPVTIEQN
ncbi:hypothetical protein [Nesterenkonia haasae]|uniref:hypothetical protein n=1 Tax=Nesterenkonia haasae TaxID=2587813 RepID=UPI001391B5BA|nr:hypothetical protein [Nesterenkonia haasae]NDK32934.1 hypothetical protein [Nesterenkonia haasae]